MSKALQLLLAVSLALSGCTVSWADNCRVTAERTGQHPIAGAKRIAIAARAGDLEIQGQKSASQVSARGTACASDQKLLDLIRIELRLDGEVLRVNALMPDIDADDAPRNAAASLDLRLEVPDHLPIELMDSSGDTEIDSVAALEVTDSSGDVTVEDVHGDVEVEADGSGSLAFDRIDRNVMIGHDGSGDIRISNVKGDARIDSDGSGNVNVRNVAGSFTLGGKGSGEVQVAEVKGAVSIPPEKHQ